MGAPAFLVAIDLGTSNIVLAYTPLGGAEPQVQILPIPQSTGPGQWQALPSLPALRFHPGADLDPALISLPWQAGPLAAKQPPAVLGAWARQLGQQQPERLVHSAKSYLALDEAEARHLPSGLPAEQGISPLLASAGYLEHLAQAWHWQHPDHPLAQQHIVLTLPASFDEQARQLTLKAAHLAGLTNVTLLEEPLAACHAWLQQPDAQAQLKQCQRLLVCDVGGGTSDFSLLQVAEDGGLRRLRVGEHLMLGGDNMDLALALQAAGKLGEVQRLTPRQWPALAQACRPVKEALLGPAAPEALPVTLLGRGSALIGQSQSTRLSAKEVAQLLLEGFFPLVPLTARPQGARSALRQTGLPYPADVAISRHLAAFLDAGGEEPLPDALLLNGGPFASPALAQRLAQQLSQWRGAPVRLLQQTDLDSAVARGAALFGWHRQQGERLIQADVARHYFVQLAGPQGLSWLCLLPRGTPVGAECPLALPLQLQCGEPVQFVLASSTETKNYAPGEPAQAPARLHPLPRLSTRLAGQGQVPVALSAHLDEIGLLALHCAATDGSARRWPLQFNLRGHEQAQPATAALPATVLAPIQGLYGARQATAGLIPRHLRHQLEQLLGPRAQWTSEQARSLADALLIGLPRRRRSAEHEQIWFSLLGYCLRPGLGMPGDPDRVARLWPLFAQGLQHGRQAGAWDAWWIFWRRLAAGLDEAAQLAVLDEVGAALMPTPPARVCGDEPLRLIGALERIPVGLKTQVAELLLARLCRQPAAADAWALGRLAARQLAYAEAEYRLPAATIRPWLAALLALDWGSVPELAFAAVAMSCQGEDGLDEALRQAVLARLDSRQTARWQGWLNGTLAPDADLLSQLWGDSLPVGLSLAAS
ncbi:Hsp70 family protein [Pseudaeromonas sp. ZJS20]|uniref:hsp70 family protein n=1 Tax=Pseudaeromonas aegiceratis TaxID=3153928 RepID=UPI00390C528A